MAGLQDKIKNVVVLMLENRSFDSILGRLYDPSPDFNGVPFDASNPWTGGEADRILAWNDDTMVCGGMTIPSPDPGEYFTDITTQIFGLNGANNQVPAPMSGFVDNYVRQTKEPPYDAKPIMHYYTPSQLPVISTLARAYAVCDQWHASAPNQTWPNRFFVHCATAGGYVNNSPPRFPYMMPTIFNRISQMGLANGWKVYFHDMPQSLTLAHLWLNRDRFRLFDEFIDDAAKGLLPCYSFIEPRYFADLGLGMPNDQHPPHDVIYAEQLIAKVYNTLRQSPNWNSTLFVITYDEHGGCFDHAPPPVAVPPGDHLAREEFAFDRYGVRVPAVLISPYIRAGTILRAPRNPMAPDLPIYPFDHTSIIATVRKCFRLGGPLTARDAAAPDLDCVLELPGPTNGELGTITVPEYQPSQQDLQNAIGRPLTDMQEGLHVLSAMLPGPGDDVEAHIARLASGAIDLVEKPPTVAAALDFISQRIGKIL
jgi:phospholipase C